MTNSFKLVQWTRQWGLDLGERETWRPSDGDGSQLVEDCRTDKRARLRFDNESLDTVLDDSQTAPQKVQILSPSSTPSFGGQIVTTYRDR